MPDFALWIKSENLDEADIFMISQLYIMQHELPRPILTEKEVHCFILVNLRMKDFAKTNEEMQDPGEMKKIPVTFVPDPRPVQLATFYWRSLLDMFSDCVGDILARKHFLPYGKFDGVLFQNIYRDMHDENNNSGLVIKKSEKFYLSKVFHLVTSNGSRVAPPLT